MTYNDKLINTKITQFFEIGSVHGVYNDNIKYERRENMPKKTTSICGIKYVLSPWQAKSLEYEARRHMTGQVADEGVNVYTVSYDTLSAHAGRRYQSANNARLTLRSYTPLPAADYVYLDLCADAQRCDSIKLGLDEALAFIEDNVAPTPQNECDADAIYAVGKFLQTHDVRPSVYMKYTRTSFTAKNLRLTLDYNLTARRDEFFTDDDTEKKLSENRSVYMHIETKSDLPDWLTHVLCELDIRRSGFSRQTAAYYID